MIKSFPLSASPEGAVSFVQFRLINSTMSTCSGTNAPRRSQALSRKGVRSKRGNGPPASPLSSLFPSFPFLRGYLVPGTGDIEMKRPLQGHSQVGEF